MGRCCRRVEALVLLAILGGAGCSRLPVHDSAGGAGVRRVSARVVRPAPVDLYDRDVETLGVLDFDGSGGRELARDLAIRLEEAGAFRVVEPLALAERLLRAGVSVGWESAPSALRWARERAAVDAVVVGRVEEFHVDGWDDEKETLTLRGTGEYSFVVNEEGKLAYREKTAYARVPLYCRTDRGTVAADYRVWDLRRGKAVATVRHELTAEIPSFCYRQDVPRRLLDQARDRLLRRLFQRLNEAFLGDVVPRAERAQLAFEVVGGGQDDGLVHRNELGILSASRGEWAQALDVWRDCLADFPAVPAIHYNLAVVYRALGRLARAEAHLAEAAARSPNELYLSALRDVRAERDRAEPVAE